MAYKSEIERLAIIIALETPARPSRGRSAYVRWDLIMQLRDAIIAAGYDLGAARTRMEELEAARQRPERIKGLRAAIQQNEREIAHRLANGDPEDLTVWGSSIASIRRAIARSKKELDALEKALAQPS